MTHLSTSCWHGRTRRRRPCADAAAVGPPPPATTRAQSTRSDTRTTCSGWTCCRRTRRSLTACRPSCSSHSLLCGRHTSHTCCLEPAARRTDPTTLRSSSQRASDFLVTFHFHPTPHQTPRLPLWIKLMCRNFTGRKSNIVRSHLHNAIPLEMG